MRACVRAVAGTERHRVSCLVERTGNSSRQTAHCGARAAPWPIARGAAPHDASGLGEALHRSLHGRTRRGTAPGLSPGLQTGSGDASNRHSETRAPSARPSTQDVGRHHLGDPRDNACRRDRVTASLKSAWSRPNSDAARSFSRLHERSCGTQSAALARRSRFHVVHMRAAVPARHRIEGRASR
jgi:hypothetical protein